MTKAVAGVSICREAVDVGLLSLDDDGPAPVWRRVELDTRRTSLHGCRQLRVRVDHLLSWDDVGIVALEGPYADPELQELRGGFDPGA